MGRAPIRIPRDETVGSKLSYLAVTDDRMAALHPHLGHSGGSLYRPIADTPNDFFVGSCPAILDYTALTCFCLSVTACNQASSASSSASISSGFGAAGFIASEVLCKRTEHWP